MPDPKHDSSVCKKISDCVDVKILDNKFSILCRFCNSCISSQGFSSHLLYKHNISREQYAWKYHSDEICKCAICNKSYFRKYSYIRLRLKNTCNNKKCMNFFRKISIEKSFLKKYGFKSSFDVPFILKKAIEHSGKTLKDNNIYHICALKRAKNLKEKGLLTIIAKKATLKKRQIDGYFSDKFLIERSNSAIKGVNTKKENGFFYNELVSLKASETRKRNGTYNKSKPEIAFGIFLNSKFDYVYSQLKINSNLCSELFGNDFFDYKKSFTFDYVVKYENLLFCICIDGIYYHGLDRPIIEIAKCKTKTDKIIFDTYYRDRYLEDFISCSKINVIKFSDVNIVDFSKKKIEKMFPYYCNGVSCQLDLFWRKFYA
jgi:hypothetical protein